jgi:hypothetical protein
MSPENNFEILFDVPLELDEAGVERGDKAIIGDEMIRLLLRENRIALAKGKTILVHLPEGSEPGMVYYNIPLVCVVHSHPECRFRWSRLAIDLSPTKGALIRDMVPREVRGDKPVELKTSIGVGMKFEIMPKVLSAEVTPAYTNSRTIYYPEIVSTGPGFTAGYWDFLALTSDYLHVNRELRLLISAQEGIPIQARFRLRAKVRFAGVAGLIPLLVRSGGIDETYRLD